MAKKKKNGMVLDIPVEFGGVSIGDGVARLGVKIDRNAITITEAVRVFVGHRLTGRVQLGGNGDSAGQETMDFDHAVEGVFDVKRIGVGVKQYGTGLAFSIEDIDVREIAKLSKGSGRLQIEQVAALPEKQKKGPDSGEGDEGFDDEGDEDE
jgi:hypothetical protein